MDQVNDQNGNAGTALTTSARDPAQELRRVGAAAVGLQQAKREMYAMLEGCEWGSGSSVVRGSGFSKAARAALAQFCIVTRANPQIHVDILGGKPYLNAQYYRDKVSADPYFIDDVQRNISPGIIAKLRDQAKAAIKEAKEMGLPEPTQEVSELLAEARYLERLHAEYAVPDWATIAYETTIRRYVENAPLEKIKNGEVDDPSMFVRVVRECNWAGNRGTVTRKNRKTGETYESESDPIGDAEPEKTARTRSFRRAARNAFSAWFDQFNDDITRATEIVEAEWEEVRERPLLAGNAISTGNGEPTAGRVALPESLPVRDLSTIADDVKRGQPESVERTQPEAQQTPEQRHTSAAADTTDPDAQNSVGTLTDEERQELRKRLFPDLKENGIPNEGRVEWARNNELPDSTGDWTREDFEKAFDILEAPHRRELLEAVGALGFETVEEFCTAKSLAVPLTLKDVRALTKIVQGAQ